MHPPVGSDISFDGAATCCPTFEPNRMIHNTHVEGIINPHIAAVVSSAELNSEGGGTFSPRLISLVTIVRSGRFKHHTKAFFSPLPQYTRLTFFRDL